MKNATIIAAVLLTAFTTSAAQDTASVFPSIPGWELTVEETVYTPNNLWDVIDGAADLFLEYNFVDLRIARYQRPADTEIKVELYRHKTAVDAFGMYSQERYPEYHFIDLGTQGYSEKGILNFLSGEYYVKISTVQSAPEAQEGLTAVGSALVQRLNRRSSWPDLLAAFPLQGKLVNSEQYVSKNFLGYSFFNNVYTASYNRRGVACKAFIIRMKSADVARRTVNNFLSSLPKNGISQLEGGYYRVRDPHNGPIMFALTQNSICGILGETDLDSENFLAELGQSLSQVR